MHPLVQDYLEKKSKEASEKALKKKNDLLTELGLFEKEYSDNTGYSDEYPEYEWDNETNAPKYYRKKPIEVTDGEYEEILKYQKRKTAGTRNVVSTIFAALAWIVFVGGFITGIVCGYVVIDGDYGSYSEFSFAIAVVYWAVSFVSGMMFLGFSEIIQLLTDIKNK